FELLERDHRAYIRDDENALPLAAIEVAPGAIVSGHAGATPRHSTNLGILTIRYDADSPIPLLDQVSAVLGTRGIFWQRLGKMRLGSDRAFGLRNMQPPLFPPVAAAKPDLSTATGAA